MSTRSMMNQADAGCSCIGVNLRYDHQDDDRNKVDEINLASEMNELSVQEREKVLEEIHGVAEIQEETAEFVSNCLQQLDSALAALSYTKRKDLDRAFFLRPSLQTDKKFKLMFLRADNFNAYQAAERMAKYFTNKLLLFGEDKLVKDITLEDLEDDAKKILFSDANIVLPYRDRACRPIWFSDCSKADYEHTSSTIRALWYDTMTTLKDDDVAQRKGITCVLFFPCKEITSNLPTISQVTALLPQIGTAYSSMPCRFTSFHFGTDDARMHFFLKSIQSSLGKQVRLRLRSHFGSAIEMKYSLLTFGIQCEGLLLTNDNDDVDLRPKYRQEKMIRRTQIEKNEAKQLAEEEAKTKTILYPAPGDVLLGRGRPNQEFSGNRRFGELVDTQMERFRRCATQFEKTCVIMDVVKKAQDSHSRFLRRTSCGWELADDKVARKKASGTFRTRIGLAAREQPPDPIFSVEDSSALSSSTSKRMKYDPSVEVNAKQRLQIPQSL